MASYRRGAPLLLPFGDDKIDTGLSRSDDDVELKDVYSALLNDFMYGRDDSASASEQEQVNVDVDEKGVYIACNDRVMRVKPSVIIMMNDISCGGASMGICVDKIMDEVQCKYPFLDYDGETGTLIAPLVTCSTSNATGALIEVLSSASKIEQQYARYAKNIDAEPATNVLPRLNISLAAGRAQEATTLASLYARRVYATLRFHVDEALICLKDAEVSEAIKLEPLDAQEFLKSCIQQLSSITIPIDLYASDDKAPMVMEPLKPMVYEYDHQLVAKIRAVMLHLAIFIDNYFKPEQELYKLLTECTLPYAISTLLYKAGISFSIFEEDFTLTNYHQKAIHVPVGQIFNPSKNIRFGASEMNVRVFLALCFWLAREIKLLPWSQKWLRYSALVAHIRAMGDRGFPVLLKLLVRPDLVSMAQLRRLLPRDLLLSIMRRLVAAESTTLIFEKMDRTWLHKNFSKVLECFNHLPVVPIIKMDQ